MARSPGETSSSHAFGRDGEERAAGYLKERGWRILDRNVRLGRKEIDLIVARQGVVAFVEVKSRRGSAFGHPLEAITWRKRRDLARAAGEWLHRNSVPQRTLRFDALALVRDPTGEVRIEHVEDAWRP